MNDSLGDRMKFLESQNTDTMLIPLLPAMARLDGKTFSSFTKGLKRPYDERLSRLMIETTKYLVKETNAVCGYTQSDEISLCWYSSEMTSQIYFNGRVFKMIGDLAGMASVFFNEKLPEYLPEKIGKRPRFDARVWNVPNLDEAVNTFIWRELDATKNSITMASRCYYSDKQLFKLNGSQKQELLFQKGINWNDYPAFFKRGTYIQRKKTFTKFSTVEIEKLTNNHQARLNPDLEIERNVISELVLPPLTQVKNRVDVIIFGQDCII